MGQGKSNFTKQELEEYEELTYLSNSEVLQAFKKYRDIDPPKVKFYIFLQDSLLTSSECFKSIYLLMYHLNMHEPVNVIYF